LGFDPDELAAGQDARRILLIGENRGLHLPVTARATLPSQMRSRHV
jgi:hypothetical protein